MTTRPERVERDQCGVRGAACQDQTGTGRGAVKCDATGEARVDPPARLRDGGGRVGGDEEDGDRADGEKGLLQGARGREGGEGGAGAGVGEGEEGAGGVEARASRIGRLAGDGERAAGGEEDDGGARSFLSHAAVSDDGRNGGARAAPVAPGGECSGFFRVSQPPDGGKEEE